MKKLIILFVSVIIFTGCRKPETVQNIVFEAESVETQLDLIVNMSQQLKNTTARLWKQQLSQSNKTLTVKCTNSTLAIMALNGM